jgi:hypothetical protein
MDTTDGASRVVARLSRSNRRPLNPEALDEFLHDDLLTHRPACLEVILEIDESAVETIRERNDYELDVLSVE